MARNATVTLTDGPLSHTVRGQKFRRGIPLLVTDQKLLADLRRNPHFMVKEERKQVAAEPALPVPVKKSRKPEPEPPQPEETEENDDEEDEEEGEKNDDLSRTELEAMSKKDLRSLADRHGITIEGHPSKAEIVDAILEAFDE